MRRFAAAIIGTAALALGGSALGQEHGHGAPAPDGTLNPLGEATNAAYEAFAGGCAPNLSRPEVMQLVMGAIGLKEAPDRVIQQIPHDEGDKVWVLPHPGVGVVAVWAPDAKRCRVLMQRGDQQTLKEAFATLLVSTRKPGLAVDKVKEEKTSSSEGPVETLAYEVYATPKSAGGDDRIYTLTLYSGETPQAAAVLEGRRISGSPPVAR